MKEKRKEENIIAPKVSLQCPHCVDAVVYTKGQSRLCVVLKRCLLQLISSISGTVLLLGQLRLSRDLAVDASVLLCHLFGVISSPLSLCLALQLGDFFLGLGDVLRVMG